MLKLYRRHKKNCGHTARPYTRCRCRIWVLGSLNGSPIRQAMNITNWEDASKKIREWESGLKPPEYVSMKYGVFRFLEDAKARNLAQVTLSKLRLVLEKQLVPFCKKTGLRNLEQIMAADIIKF